MKIGIIGSRQRRSKQDQILVFNTVFEAIKLYGFNDVELVSGGCALGADRFAEEAAKYFGVSITIHYPQQIPKAKNYSETVERFYRRNDKVARDSDILYALVTMERKGGTEYTVNKALSLGKSVFII